MDSNEAAGIQLKSLFVMCLILRLINPNLLYHKATSLSAINVTVPCWLLDKVLGPGGLILSSQCSFIASESYRLHRSRERMELLALTDQF